MHSVLARLSNQQLNSRGMRQVCHRPQAGPEGKANLLCSLGAPISLRRGVQGAPAGFAPTRDSIGANPSSRGPSHEHRTASLRNSCSPLQASRSSLVHLAGDGRLPRLLGRRCRRDRCLGARVSPDSRFRTVSVRPGRAASERASRREERTGTGVRSSLPAARRGPSPTGARQPHQATRCSICDVSAHLELTRVMPCVTGAQRTAEDV